MMNSQKGEKEDEKKKTDLRDMNPFKSGDEKIGPFSPEDILSLTPVGRAAKLAKVAKASGAFSKIKGLFSRRSKPQTAPKAPKPPKSRGKLTKTLSKFDLPSLPSLNGLSAATSAVRKMTKSKEEEELKKEAYQWLGITLLEKSAAWTRSEGKNPSGGLNAKGVASYRAQNPGSKLKTAVTTKPSKLKKGSKAANRRKSFCARMKGMRKRQKSSNNTGKDRLSLSLKKWNC